jgi:uncharacterized protein (TIGR02598 family)
MKPNPPRQSDRGRSAFSLVEIVLTIGIVAFAFVGLMGLLPVGLASFRTAIDASVGSQIFQRVVSDLEQMEFDSLLNLGKSAQESNSDYFVLDTRYFDDQGVEVASGRKSGLTAEEELQVIYHVRIRISKPGPAIVSSGTVGRTSLPASQDQYRFTLRDSVFATIQVAHNPGKRVLPADGRLLWDETKLRQQNLPLGTYTAVITRNGYKKR